VSFPPPCQHILFRRGVLGEGGAVFVHEGEAVTAGSSSENAAGRGSRREYRISPPGDSSPIGVRFHHADRQIIEAHVLVVHDPHIRHRAYFVADGRRQEHVRPPPE